MHLAAHRRHRRTGEPAQRARRAAARAALHARRPVQRAAPRAGGDVEVPIDDLPAALDGFTIVQISDIHVGPTIKRRYVDAIVDAVNRLEAGPDRGHGRSRRWHRAAPRRAHAAARAVERAPWHFFRHRQSRVLLRRERLDRRIPPPGTAVLLNEHVCSITTARAPWSPA